LVESKKLNGVDGRYLKDTAKTLIETDEKH
jgi:hypothetical protein